MILMNTPTVTETVPVVTGIDGVMWIADTRVTLDTLIHAFQDGATAEEIAQQYPVVPLADIYALIGYCLHRRTEIEAYLDQRRQVAERVRQENEAHFNPAGIRARLLARCADGTA